MYTVSSGTEYNFINANYVNEVDIYYSRDNPFEEFDGDEPYKPWSAVETRIEGNTVYLTAERDFFQKDDRFFEFIGDPDHETYKLGD
jgi:hypothetical protein